MKEKFPTFYKMFNWLFKNWVKIAEVIVVIWAVDEILSKYYVGYLYKSEYPISPVLAYFLSAVLILYLLRKYERKN